MKTIVLLVLVTAILLHAQSSNITVVIRGKTVTAREVERMIREHATKNKITFDFDQSKSSFYPKTNSTPTSIAAHVIFVPTDRPGRCLDAFVTRDGRVSAMEGLICGGL